MTAKDGTGARATTTFLWTVDPGRLGPADHAAGRLPGPVPGPGRGQQHRRHQGRDLHLQRHQRPAVDRRGRRHRPRRRQVPRRPSAGTANGTAVDLYTCNGTGAQQWQPQAERGAAQPGSPASASTTPARRPVRHPGRDLDLHRRRQPGRGSPRPAAPAPAPARSPATRAVPGRAVRRRTPTARRCRSTPATAPARSSGPSAGRHAAGAGQVPGHRQRRHGERHARPALRPATAPARRSGSRSATARCSTRSPAGASTTPARRPVRAPSCRSGPAQAPPTSPGRCRRRYRLRATPAHSDLSSGITPGSGRHSEPATTPGSSSSRPSKNRVTCSWVR